MWALPVGLLVAERPANSPRKNASTVSVPARSKCSLKGRLLLAIAPFHFAGKILPLFPLRGRAGSGGLLQNFHCLAGVCNPKE